MFRLWAFWLPVLYLLVIFLVWLDMSSAWSGTGESNVGIWIYMLSFWPTALVQKIMGLPSRWPIENVGKVIGLQAFWYLVAGALIDLIRAINKASTQRTD